MIRRALCVSAALVISSVAGGCAVESTAETSASSDEAVKHCHGHTCSAAPACTTIAVPPELAAYGCSDGVRASYGYPDNAWVFTCPAGTPRPDHLLGLPPPSYGTNWEEEFSVTTDFDDGSCVRAPTDDSTVQFIDWYTQGVSGGCHGPCGAVFNN